MNGRKGSLITASPMTLVNSSAFGESAFIPTFQPFHLEHCILQLKKAILAKTISVESIQRRQSSAINVACEEGIYSTSNNPKSPSRMPKPPGVRKLKNPTIHANAKHAVRTPASVHSTTTKLRTKRKKASPWQNHKKHG